MIVMRGTFLLLTFSLLHVGCSPPSRGGEAACCASATCTARAENRGRVEEPHVAIDAEGRLVGVWAAVSDDGSADILFSRYDSSGPGWATPRCVQPTGHTAVAGRQVGPRLAVARDGDIFVSWVDRDRDPTGDILFSRSPNGGRSFGEPARVNDDESAMTGQEYHGVAVASDGAIGVVWLDERDAPPTYPNQKQVYFSSSSDGGRTFSKNRALTSSDRGVCPCCRPSISAGDDGALHVIYRDRVDDTLFIRMLTRAAGESHFSPAVTLSDGWKFPACPVNGPGVAAGPNGTVWAAWVEGEGESEILWWARSDDEGASFTVGKRVNTGDAPSSGVAGVTRLALTALPTESSQSGAVAVWEDRTGAVWTALLPVDGGQPRRPPLRVAGGGTVAARSPSVVASSRIISLCWIEESALSVVEGPLRLAPRFPTYQRFAVSIDGLSLLP